MPLQESIELRVIHVCHRLHPGGEGQLSAVCFCSGAVAPSDRLQDLTWSGLLLPKCLRC